MIGTTSCPPATARAPPGMKSFWTSTTSRISRSPGVISVMLLCAREQALHQSAHLVAVPLTRADGHARHCATGTDEERRRQPRDPPSAGRLELGVEQDREGQIEVPHVRLDESARRSPVHGHGKDDEATVTEPYVRNLNLTFPILLDPELQTSGGWRVTGLPATFLVRPGRSVAGMAVGAREWDSDEMRALVERLLPGAEEHD